MIFLHVYSRLQRRSPLSGPHSSARSFVQVPLVKLYLSHVLYLLKGKQKTHVEPLSSFLVLSPQVCEEAGWKPMLGNLVGNKIRTQEIYSSFKTSLTSAPLPFYSLQVNEDAICRLSVLGSMGMLRALDGTRSLHSPGGSARGARMIIIAPTAEINSFDNFVVA